MRRFGNEIKNNDKKVPQEQSSEIDALKAQRLARFGEVDPKDLKRSDDKRRDKKHK